MNIAAYRFGRIEIDGRTYTSDVIITPERVVDSCNRLQKEPSRIVAALHLTC